jgi:ketosteroid isomerase-like protein
MKRLVFIAAAAAVSCVVAGSAWSQVASSASDSTFRTFLEQFEEGTRRFVNGDAQMWKRHASQREDVTIMGGWGSYEKGWNDVAARYDWAAARFRNSGAIPTFEYLASGASGDLAYTVTIERSEVRVVGQDTPASMPLRVTQIFRKESGEWKLIHRHADPLMEKTTPAAVLKK